ncbi:MAG: AAA family ATPase [Lachnospiraceae bacterium]|nr:AAA family ATPase [Lachnospiraceae bacterium]
MYYLNTDVPYMTYKEAVNSEIYVDKSLMIEKISRVFRTNGKYICITRPRRFGKTINASMLGAYYTEGIDSGSLFDNLKIAQTADYLKNKNKYNVIYIDLSRMPNQCASYAEYIEYIIYKLVSDLKEAYGIQENPYLSVADMFAETGESFVFIFDEWDSVFYKEFMDKKDKDNYLFFLKDLLKDRPYVEMAYMTGVLPIAKYSSGSELNMFDEYNFMNDNVYDDYFGFQEDEVRTLCDNYGTVPYEEMKKWYDGYYTGEGKALFNPRSVSKALMRGKCLNYWTESGPMNEVADCIEHNVDAVREDIVKMVAGIPVAVKLMGYSVAELQLDTRDEILSAMVVYGFLTYYDGMLRIPNRELMEKYQGVLARKSMGAVKQIVEQSEEMMKATLAGDEKKVAAILETVHDKEIPFLQYNDENALSCVITLCYLYAREEYDIEREAKSGKGYCDYLFIPKKKEGTAIILELKVGSSCEEAIEQIRKKNYIQRVQHCRNILMVGINYDKEKHHQCKIIQYVEREA